MPKLIDLTGKVYGRLLVISQAELTKDKKGQWLCRCSCGKERVIRASNLKRKIRPTQSCGCLLKETYIYDPNANSNLPEYGIWKGMRTRCSDPTIKQWMDYGGRGIKVCPQWESNFSQFLSDVGRRPDPKMSLDRLDNNGNYEPGNVAWRTKKQQQNNMRSNARLTYKGETMTMTQWCERLGLNRTYVSHRLKRGKTVEEAFEEPVVERLKLKRKEPRTITYKGHTRTISEWAVITGISQSAITGRVNRGCSPHDTLTKPAETKFRRNEKQHHH